MFFTVYFLTLSKSRLIGLHFLNLEGWPDEVCGRTFKETEERKKQGIWMLGTTPEMVSPAISLLFQRFKTKHNPKTRRAGSMRVSELGGGVGLSCCLQRRMPWVSVLQSQLCFFSSVSCLRHSLNGIRLNSVYIS